MEVVVGPVTAASMGAWVEFGRRLLHSAGPGADVPSDAASAFDTYLDEWEGLAAHDGEVTWATDVEPELAEYLVYAFYRVAKDVTDEAGGSIVPAPAAPFYWLLVGALLDALAGEGGSRAEFAAHLREFWPGDHEIP
ncbi:hypothetical protein HC251_17750 [Iamia sp. SCSIO 61187]|uniref:hypothetical protein n=1 Tax=Iamia sp. SCSIO 61187 TaxID=2722752 RepID=UPI001C63900C|nr:hypothetical protein [Iamia sp. SCSIO 61187]QYG94101.1 hypothetical protein HC251_17750 [Iamia sp. SCSIO 61187]